jgi:hypothetical protein
MPVREATHRLAQNRVAPASRRLSGRHPAVSCRLPTLILCVSLLVSPLAGKTPSVSALGPGYVSALSAANRLLQAWQSGDVENGMVLLSSHAKEAATTEVVEQFFSNPSASAYEIGRGKLVKRGRYEFPVVLVTGNSKKLRRKFSSIVVVNAGNDDWAVDKLP